MAGVLAKLKKKHILIIGCVLIALVGGASFFLMIKPKLASVQTLQKSLSDTNAVVQMRDQKVKALQEAKNNVAVVEAKWAQYKSSLKTIRFKSASDYDAMVQLWHEYREELGPAFEKFMQGLGVRFGGLALPAPDMTPPPIPANGFIAVPASGTLTCTIQGDYVGIMNALRKMRDFSRLVTIGEPISIAGVSPNLTASFPITFYLLADVPPGLAPVMAAPAAGGMGGPPGMPGPGGPGGAAGMGAPRTPGTKSEGEESGGGLGAKREAKEE